MLRRYTSIQSLLCILTNKQLTLLDPATWNDKNDLHYLSVYTQKKKLKRTFALCQSEKMKPIVTDVFSLIRIMVSVLYSIEIS